MKKLLKNIILFASAQKEELIKNQRKVQTTEM
jgi:hypothetical protein